MSDAFEYFIQKINETSERLGVKTPNQQQCERSFQLHQRLLGILQEEQCDEFSAAEFIQHLLFEPHLGYYAAGISFLNEKGDFQTAPEISSEFGACIATAIKPTLAVCPNIIEFGAGSGQLAADILRSLHQDNVHLEHYYIVDVSESLIEQQKATIKALPNELGTKVTWLSSITELSSISEVSTDGRKFSGCVIANEVLDAIPAHTIRFHNNQVEEEKVVWRNDQWQSVWSSDCSQPVKNWLGQHATKIDWRSNHRYEVAPLRAAFLDSLTRYFDQGVLLFLDYGYGAQEFFHPERAQGTRTCFFRHHKHRDWLSLLGLQDITSHVNFSEVCFTLEQAGWALSGFTHQANFLLENGLFERVELNDNSSTQSRLQQSQSLQKLLMPSEMGEVVKVIAFHKNISENARPQVSPQWTHKL